MPLRSRLLLFAGAAIVAASAVGVLISEDARSQGASKPRVLVLGFDGASHDTVERLLGEGRLPHLAELRGRGGFAKLAPSNPAQSPVSWASMTTGGNPGRTGIFDFLKRVLDRESGVGIEIGLAKKEMRPTVPAWMRVGVVTAAGVFGVVLGLAGALLLGLRDPRWRKGGRLQAALTFPAAILAVVAQAGMTWIPENAPHAVNQRGGEPFWVTLDREGVRCVALEAPVAFPADEMHNGACLSGLGTPDARASWGIWTVWTDDPSPAYGTDLETGGEAYFVEPGKDEFQLTLAGPLDPLPDTKAIEEARHEAKLEGLRRRQALDWTDARRRLSETHEQIQKLQGHLLTQVRVRIERGVGATVTPEGGAAVRLAPGEWSDLIPVTFRRNPLVRLDARVRFLLVDAGGPPDGGGRPAPFELFVAPVEFDAASLPPNVHLSSPHSYAGELVDAVGQFDTLGWPEMTNPVKDGVLPDEHFLAHLKLLLKKREERLLDRLARDDWDCFFAVFGEVDRLQHAFYRHVDPEWPGHTPETREAAKRFGPEVDRIYEAMDRTVGLALDAAGPGTEVYVVSDHGFAPFRRGVNLNNFLRSQGFQVGGDAAKQSVGNLTGGGAFFSDVDWSRTKAYGMGLGNIYLNLQGREPSGVVPPERAQETMDAIRRKLLELEDTDGKRVVKEVYYGKDLYSGDRVEHAPDLVVGFAWGYRVSWQTSLGALDEDVITDNTLPWSGDHCSVDPSLVPGILFSSRPLSVGDRVPSVPDVATTVLSRYGITRDTHDGIPFTE